MIKNIIWVSIGGALGTVLRYLGQKWMQELYPQLYPWGTFLVNFSGCFLIGVFLAVSERNSLLNAEARLFLMTGLCGGYTTFSAFALENMNLLRAGNISNALLYTLCSVVLGILAVFAGVAVIKLL